MQGHIHSVYIQDAQLSLSASLLNTILSILAGALPLTLLNVVGVNIVLRKEFKSAVSNKDSVSTKKQINSRSTQILHASSFTHKPSSDSWTSNTSKSTPPLSPSSMLRLLRGLRVRVETLSVGFLECNLALHVSKVEVDFSQSVPRSDTLRGEQESEGLLVSLRLLPFSMRLLSHAIDPSAIALKGDFKELMTCQGVKLEALLTRHRYPGHARMDSVGMAVGEISVDASAEQLVLLLPQLQGFVPDDSNSCQNHAVVAHTATAYLNGAELGPKQGLRIQSMLSRGGDQAVSLLHAWPAKLSVSLSKISVEFKTHGMNPAMTGPNGGNSNKAPCPVNQTSTLACDKGQELTAPTWLLTASVCNIVLKSSREAVQRAQVSTGHAMDRVLEQSWSSAAPPIGLEAGHGAVQVSCTQLCSQQQQLPRKPPFSGGEPALSFMTKRSMLSVAVFPARCSHSPAEHYASGLERPLVLVCSTDLEVTAPRLKVRQDQAPDVLKIVHNLLAALTPDVPTATASSVDSQGSRGVPLASRWDPALSSGFSGLGLETVERGNQYPASSYSVPAKLPTMLDGAGAQAPPLEVFLCFRIAGGSDLALTSVGGLLPCHNLSLSTFQFSLTLSPRIKLPSRSSLLQASEIRCHGSSWPSAADGRRSSLIQSDEPRRPEYDQRERVDLEDHLSARSCGASLSQDQAVQAGINALDSGDPEVVAGSGKMSASCVASRSISHGPSGTPPPAAAFLSNGAANYVADTRLSSPFAQQTDTLLDGNSMHDNLGVLGRKSSCSSALDPDGDAVAGPSTSSPAPVSTTSTTKNRCYENDHSSVHTRHDDDGRRIAGLRQPALQEVSPTILPEQSSTLVHFLRLHVTGILWECWEEASGAASIVAPERKPSAFLRGSTSYQAKSFDMPSTTSKYSKTKLATKCKTVVFKLQQASCVHISQSVNSHESIRQAHRMAGREGTAWEEEAGEGEWEEETTEEAVVILEQVHVDLQPRIMNAAVDVIASLVQTCASLGVKAVGSDDLLPQAAVLSGSMGMSEEAKEVAEGMGARVLGNLPKEHKFSILSKRLALLDVQILDFKFTLGHEQSLVSQFSSLGSPSTTASLESGSILDPELSFRRPQLTTAGPASTAQQGPAGNSTKVLVAKHEVSVTSFHVQLSPSQGWAVLELEDVRIKQHAGVALNTLNSVLKNRASTASAFSQSQHNNAHGVMETSLFLVKRLDAKLRTTALALSKGTAELNSAAPPLLKVTADEPHLHLEADTALVLLGAGQYMTSLASRLVMSAGASSSPAASDPTVNCPDSMIRDHTKFYTQMAEVESLAQTGVLVTTDEEEGGGGGVETLVMEVCCKSVELSCCFAASEHVSLKVRRLSLSGGSLASVLNFSSHLEEAVVDHLVLSGNGRQIFGANFASILLNTSQQQQQGDDTRASGLPDRSTVRKTTTRTAAAPAAPGSPPVQDCFSIPPSCHGSSLLLATTGVPPAVRHSSLCSNAETVLTTSTPSQPLLRTKAFVAQPAATGGTSKGDSEEGDMAPGYSESGEDQPVSPSTLRNSEAALCAGTFITGFGFTAMKQVLLLGPVLDVAVASLGSERAAILEGAAGGASGVAHHRQVQRQTARERFELDSSMLPPGGPELLERQPQPQSDDLDDQPGSRRSPNGELVVLLPVEVVLGQATLCVPYDESPMRIYELSEVWEEAVKQVLEPYLLEFQSALQGLYDLCNGCSPGMIGKTEQALPRQETAVRKALYIEVALEVRSLAINIEHHPMESWLAQHARPLHQASATRQLWERMLSSLAEGKHGGKEQRQHAREEGPAARRKTTGDVAARTSTHTSYSKDGDLKPISSHLKSSVPGGGPDNEESEDELEDSMAANSGVKSIFQNLPSVTMMDLGPLRQWQQAMRDVCAQYRWMCSSLPALSHGKPCDSAHTLSADKFVSASRSGSLLCLTVTRMSGVFTLARPSIRSHNASIAHICRLDAPSVGIEMGKVVPLSIDMWVGELRAYVGGEDQPVLSCSSLSTTGWLIRARQLAAPPLTSSLFLPVGRYHGAWVKQDVKGSKPPMKNYTDLRVEMEDLDLRIGVGLEPALSQVADAIRDRVVPPDSFNSDGSEAKEDPLNEQGKRHLLKPWDKIRYLWRGELKLMARSFNALISAAPSPQLEPHEPFLHVSAGTLAVAVTGGRVDITVTGLTALGHSKGPDAGPGEPLLLVPLLSIPLLKLTVHVTWKLPSGRNPMHHHIFPRLTHLGTCLGQDALGTGLAAGGQQLPLYAGDFMRAEGLSVGLDFALSSDVTASKLSEGGKCTSSRSKPSCPDRRGGDFSDPFLAAISQHFTSGWFQLQPSSVPRLYIGEMQVNFLSCLCRMVVDTPVHLRGSWKRSTFHQRHPDWFRRKRLQAASRLQEASSVSKPEPPADSLKMESRRPLEAFHYDDESRGLGQLIMKLDMNASADVLEIHHDAQDHNDPSDLVCLRSSNVRFSQAFSYQKVMKSEKRPSRDVSWMHNEASRTSISLEAYELKLSKPCNDSVAAAASAVQAALRSRQGTMNHTSADETPLPDIAGDAGVIMTASCLLVRQAPMQISQNLKMSGVVTNKLTHRPMRLVMQDLKCMYTPELRNAFISTFTHIQNGFKHGAEPPKPRCKDNSNPEHMRTTSGAVEVGMMAEDPQSSSATTPPPPSYDRQHRPHGSAGFQDKDSVSVGKSGMVSLEDILREEEAIVAYLKRLKQEESAKKEEIIQAGAWASGAGESSASQRSTMDSYDNVEDDDHIPAISDLKSMVHNLRSSVADMGMAEMMYTPAGRHFNRIASSAASASSNHRHLQHNHDSQLHHVSVHRPTTSSSNYSGGSGGRVLLPGGSSASSRVWSGRDDFAEVHGWASGVSRDSKPGSSESSTATTAAGPPLYTNAGASVLTASALHLSYEIEFIHVQFALVPEIGAAGLLVATDSALLAGYNNRATQERITSLNLEHLQAYALAAKDSSTAEPITTKPPAFPWLDIINGKLTPVASSLVRTTSTSATMRHSSGMPPASSSSAAAASAATASRPVGGKLYKILTPFKFHVLRTKPMDEEDLQEINALPPLRPPTQEIIKLSIHLPTLEGELESWQFYLVLAIITEVIASPMPKVNLLLQQHADSVEWINQFPDVRDASLTLQLAKENLRALQHEVIAATEAALNMEQLTSCSEVGCPPPVAAAFLGKHRVGMSTTSLYGGTTNKNIGSGTTASAGSGMGSSTTASVGSGMGSSTTASAGSGMGSSTTASVRQLLRTLHERGHSSPWTQATQAIACGRKLADSGRAIQSMLSGKSAQSVPVAYKGAAQMVGQQSRRGDVVLKNHEAMLDWFCEQVVGAQDSVINTHLFVSRLRAEAELLTQPPAKAAATNSSMARPPPPSKTSSSSSAFVVGKTVGKKAAAEDGKGVEYAGHDCKATPKLSTAASCNSNTTWTVLVALDTAVLRLRRNGIAFVEAEVKGLMYHSELDEDYHGYTRLALNRLTLRDIQNLVGPSKGGMPAGLIMEMWQADASLQEEDLMSLLLLHGGVNMEQKLMVFDHIEVVLHPLVIHLTYNMATALQEYFQLMDNATTAHSNDAALAKSTKSNAVGGSTGANDKVERSSQGITSGRKSDFYDDQNAAGTHQAAPSGGYGGFNPEVHGKRGGLLAMGFSQQAGIRHVTSSSLPGMNASEDYTITASEPAERFSRRQRLVAWDSLHISQEPYRYGCLYRKGQGNNNPSSGGITMVDYPNKLGGANHIQAAAQRSQAGASSSKMLMRFHHIRFNKMYARLTWEGPPISISDWGIVLDPCVYRNVDGVWNTILNKYKWDVVMSIIKSATGWQARKVEDLPDEETLVLSVMGKVQKGKRLAGSLKEWLKAAKGGLGGLQLTTEGIDVEASQSDEATYVHLVTKAVRLRQKQRRLALILGNNYVFAIQAAAALEASSAKR
ncbi:hypothetical protein CEUSTIGMA_g1213.t1 [Chlamydomonas eustigma]|uniref:FMP27/BLTP2/Hobbit GFWDK motif-containing RBG unit domain-containing protein n=1 Tax=Chlamydomonas eustigma TaxID=1157962 RepID=A0A250WSY1_9CHLO|nr:hypothetical protein CEUSTIGMA_g1213.t1 [Chlamydomonas eustigma]|eukprot:GAX73762.1 hypothetical protein CEUSTIGMA_g1213.t1 [Chlamydomonas eustigma]